MSENPVIIFGAGPLGLVAKNILESNGRVVYGFLDDNKKLHGHEIQNVSVLSSTDDDGYLKFIGKKCEALIAIDEIRFRKSLVEMLNEIRKVQPVNGIHIRTTISEQFELGHGNLIDMGVHINSGVAMGGYNIIQMGALIGVGVKIGNYVQIGSGSIVSQEVVVEDDVFIGTGVTIVPGITIGKGARIGAGSVVVAPVKPREVIFGNPAQPVKSK